MSRRVFFGALWLIVSGASLAVGQTTSSPVVSSGIAINIAGMENSDDIGVALQLLMVMTLLTLAPSLIMLTTSFTRIVIVLSFVRTAMGVNQAPSNQIIIGLGLFLTFFIMTPSMDRIYGEAIEPYLNKEIKSTEALSIASQEMKAFMLGQTREDNIEWMLSMANMGSTTIEELPMRIVIPAFILSELKTAFQMGFMIFVPFLVIDFIISASLMSMGMMMMPPTMIALPFKILLFVLVDGWNLVVSSLVKSFLL